MITINNWSRHQHYKNRKPPWIKLYRDLLDDIEYRQLSDSAARLLIDLWLIASETNSGEVKIDIKTLAWRLRDASKTIADYGGFIKELNKQGFISVDSNMLAECKQDAIPEREGETEREGEKEKDVSLPSISKASVSKKGTRFSLQNLPDDWETFCREKRPDLHPHSVFEQFKDYWVGVAGAKGVKLDWTATWRNWVRNQKAAPGAKPKRNNFNEMNYGEAGDL